MHLRNPPRAVALANKSTQLEPKYGNHWTALGIAQYRNGQSQAARSALVKSLELETGGWGADNIDEKEAINLFFLAMAHWQMGDHDEARQSYHLALEWMDKEQTHREQVLRFRAEAEELLKITPEKPANKTESN
jgi:Flp pilus assembly protein TadD